MVVTVLLRDASRSFRAVSLAMQAPEDDSSMNARADPSVAFIPAKEDFGIEIVVNFGILTGRAATHAEIDRLADWLLESIDAVTIVGEERHDIGSNAEAVVNQVRIEVAESAVPGEASERTALQEWILERAEHWARECSS